MGWDKNLAVFNSKEAEKVGVAVNRNVEHWREDEISWDTWSCWDIFWHFYTAPVFRVWISDGSNDTIHLQLCPWKHGSSNCCKYVEEWYWRCWERKLFSQELKHVHADVDLQAESPWAVMSASVESCKKSWGQILTDQQPGASTILCQPDNVSFSIKPLPWTDLIIDPKDEFRQKLKRLFTTLFMTCFCIVSTTDR